MNKFILLDEIILLTHENITGKVTFNDTIPFAPFIMIETLAQLGAIHIRYLTSFEKHAFLLKIKKSSKLPKSFLKGTFIIKGRLTGQSKKAFSYGMQVEKNDLSYFTGNYLFALIEYDTNFKRSNLKKHYQKVFSCLTKNLKIN